MEQQHKYAGQELAFFEKAFNWKSYFASLLKPYIGINVLEVGSGIGATTKLLNDGSAEQWTLLEPDPELYQILKQRMSDGSQYRNCVLKNETISGIDKTKKFDTIIYIDVLEHIENDKMEMQLSADLLKTNGHLIILSPAFPFLFSPFDKEIGHFRRYTSTSLKEAMPPSLGLVKLKYLDSVGFFASLANKLALQQKYPTEKQISVWDKWMIPVSKITDKLFFHSFGKSILGIWKKSEQI